MNQNLPSKIGKYEVLEVLGEGGMGTVYKGIDPLIGRLVAIKVIVTGYIDNPELLKRFYREAKAVGNLQHPNIVTVYDLGEENKNPYLVMQYLDGEPLNKIIAARRELPLLQKLGIIAKVCDALGYAHQRDIVHRDVKPANVILLKDGQVKLLDFGIARLGAGGHNDTETQKGQVMGTMSYMAPEQLNEEIVDGRCDVYATGVMLFELLTYRLPFESSDLGSLIAKKLQGGPPPSLSKYLENYPPELDDIMARAVAKDREERYGTAQDFAFDIERLMERLKRDMVSHYVDRARACISSAELSKAKEILSEVLKIDTQHTAAKELLHEVQQSLQQQQRSERVRQLRQHAEEAVGLKQFDDASKFVDEAIKLDRTDPELLNLREHIQEVKQRSQQVKKLLHLAEVAQQTGELGVFERALEDALELDPEDPQARVLQASLIRLQAEQEKEAGVQELLGAARREIAARKFDTALEYIVKAEELDPHRNDIPALKQMVLAGQEQETRKRQLQQLCGAIQQELEANNLRIARDLADKALRAFPGEPALVRMKSAADSQLEADERKRFIEARIAAASKLLDAGEASRALSLMQEASRQFPTDTRLRDFLQMVRQAAQKSSTQREQAEMLDQARDAMREKRFANAVEILEAGQIKYPDSSDIGDLLALARKEQEMLTQKAMAGEVSEQARTLVAHQAFGDALSLLEKTVVDNSDPSLQQFLQNVRAQAAEFDASLDALKQEAMALLDAGYCAEALTKLQSQAAQFGHTSRFREFLLRVEEQVTEAQESRQQIARVLDEAKLYLRRGALREAEAALAECRAKAPRDADVIALSAQLIEAKAALEHEHEIRPPYVMEVPPSSEPKVSASAATVMFNPSAAVADLTPPAGTTVGSENVDAGAALAAPPISVKADEKDVATRFFTIPVEAPSPPSISTGEDQAASRLREQSTERAPAGPPPEVSGRIKPPNGKLLAVGLLIALCVIAAGAYWLVTRTSRIKLPTLAIQTSPTGATVHAGTEACTAPCTVKLKPGKYEITAELSGFVSAKKFIELHGNQSESLVLPPTSETVGSGASEVRSFVSLEIQTSPAGATVHAGTETCTAPCTVKLNPGKYEITADLSGFVSAKKSIELHGNQSESLVLPPTSETVGSGAFVSLKIQTSPAGATVHAGTETCTAPCTVKLNPGKYEITADLSGFVSAKKSIELHGNQSESLVLPPTSETVGNGAFVSLKIQTSPAGATVHAGTETCTAPCTVKLKPGKYKITADLSGFVSAKKFIELHGNQSESLVLPPTSETVGSGASEVRSFVSLEIQTSPAGATVHAGTETCTAPCTVKLKPGKYEITADLSGFVSAKKSIELHGNQSESLVLPPTSETVGNEASEVRSFVSLEIQTSPAGATVHAGTETCTAPCTVKLKPGKYEITADLSGFVSAKKSIELHGNQSESLVLPPTVANDTGIHDLLEEYVAAYQDKSELRLRRIWPGMSDKRFGGLTAALNDADSVHVALDNCQAPVADGVFTHVTCHQTINVKAHGRTISLPSTQVFTLRKLRADWIIDNVR